MVYKMHKLSTNTFIFSLKEFLPKEYIKQRGSEKKIFQVCIKMYTVKKQKVICLSTMSYLENVQIKRPTFEYIQYTCRTTRTVAR